MSDNADNFFDRLENIVFSSSSGTDEVAARPETAREYAPGEILGKYRILSLSRSGGMGTVYRARDTRLNRDIAIKFPLSPGSSGEHQQLISEARALAGLDHPNVCSIHEIGETEDGSLFIAMPFYEGETLKERLSRSPVSEAASVDIGLQLARGLQAAHEHGVIHRDVKPGNVMVLPDGSIRLVDFGLAMPVDAHAESGGATPGTVAYMSPEQIRGLALDGRTDLWSLGVILYEMLAGVRPFTGPDRRTMIRSILNDQPAYASSTSSPISSRLQVVLQRLLNKDPAKRYQSAAELISELEQELSGLNAQIAPPERHKHRTLYRAAAGALLMFLGFAGWQVWRDREVFRSIAARAAPSIAVLPLTYLGNDSSDAPIAAGITEQLIAALASAGDVRVIASSSVATLKYGEMDIRQVAESLGVNHLLQGGMQRNGDRLRIQVRLVNGKDGATRWSESYDGSFSNLFQYQEQIARAVAGELQLRFDRDRQFVRHRTRNIKAYELYVRGSDPLLLRGQAGIWKAQDFYQQAIAVDSSYAAAHAGLAITYLRRARLASDPGMPVSQLIEMAHSEAQKAIRLDSTLAEAHYSLGRVLEGMLDFRGSAAAMRRAIELDPNRSVYRRSLSYLHAWTGRPEDELAEARRALETDPLNPYALTAVASGLYATGRYDEALANFQKLTVIKPPLQGVSFAMAQCYAKKGLWPEAIASLRPGAEAGDPLFMALLGHMLARTGATEEANRLLSELVQRSKSTGVGAFHVAIVYAGFGNLDETFQWLNRSIDDRSIASFIMGPTFAELREDPRFDRLKARLGLDA